MAIDILYFAWVRERIGLDGESVTPPDDVVDVAALIDWLATSSDAHATALADRARIRAAVDQRFATPDTSIVGAREVALFPPVTGG
ncbi:molybdopterin converting factor subunit 1 [Sphingomonas sp. BIUV-7]|uniref:Molybdopterin converting factor subunit 1 n=1 Tax=Sphingomonas natans TaxID=3063330 RepID=A0ABT8Y5H7_9SPHN|nr:molybdopterin converting factor subunit 1 [Sphingomonas sp. BIUV-7]MDO6412964.1 molybdopterin converting factor subunit 1 [Sphingomonas sp. BIUV-7]